MYMSWPEMTVRPASTSGRSSSSATVMMNSSPTTREPMKKSGWRWKHISAGPGMVIFETRSWILGLSASVPRRMVMAMVLLGFLKCLQASSDSRSIAGTAPRQWRSGSILMLPSIMPRSRHWSM